VIVRPMGGYQLPEWIRISIGTPKENQRCLEALKTVLGAELMLQLNRPSIRAPTHAPATAATGAAPTPRTISASEVFSLTREAEKFRGCRAIHAGRTAAALAGCVSCVAVIGGVMKCAQST